MKHITRKKIQNTARVIKFTAELLTFL